MEFKIGDVVQLKSGGPAMTIVGVENDRAQCEWFTASGDARDGTYPVAALRKLEDGGDTPMLESQPKRGW